MSQRELQVAWMIETMGFSSHIVKAGLSTPICPLTPEMFHCPHAWSQAQAHTQQHTCAQVNVHMHRDMVLCTHAHEHTQIKNKI